MQEVVVSQEKKNLFTNKSNDLSSNKWICDMHLKQYPYYVR